MQVVPVNIIMFIPTVVLGVIGGLLGALFNTIILKATAFRGQNPSRTHLRQQPLKRARSH
jgi:H+/Cl- antiporter ClcA